MGLIVFFHSCPDLSTLQISSLPQPANDDPSSIEGKLVTAPPSRSTSPDALSLRSGSRKLVSTKKRVSRKARGVLGKVRAFQRIAAAKMAHPTIKIDTSVQATKRALPEDNESFEILDGPDQDDPGLEAGDTESVPPFLCQSVLEIHQKFEELEWMQRARLAEGMLANDPSHRWALEVEPEVKARNRYLNVQAWANSRVHLRVNDGECDFINASPIALTDSVSQEERRYIATQGPKVGNISHFWHMVFHETKEVGVIVMLTQTFESGREKCSQYFPLNADNPLILLRENESDPFVSNENHQIREENIVGQVALLETTFDESSRSEIRKLRLTLGMESKVVWHYLFAGWADYSKPEGDDRSALLHLIEQSGAKSSPDNPRIVHCSAGVGRTGTFIALDHLLLELQSGQLLQVTGPDVDPVFETVNQMREQRMMMVYNEMQLQFIYEVLREQTDRKLGKAPETIGRKSDERSSKMAKLSTEIDYLPSSKPELEPVPDRTFTPTRSWSGTPEVSDNE
ncbi:protein-tyrosine phosphatase-like protein [Aspergillus alliaceus]|uniref:Protein-tyrosine phosphatase-like protein n=1 Tax=Petromyces alliaceus TaxID=209559 RepID=A0A5N7C8S1_PETAA|nr:protein-tyrosine phosphatase-like protein [Aspergillus alliaceus]